ncbi:MAG: Phosphoglycerate kinase, partial [Candidatus Woesebacteria bacterium GW2011_GWA1_40_45]
EYMGDERLVSVRVRGENEKLVIGNLTQDKEDITLNTIGAFKEEIKKARTILLAGVLGKYEDEGHRQGTKEIFEAVANSSAFKVAGGGDTEAAITVLKLNDKFDWMSVGGGAMLEFLCNKTLPGIEALLH